MLDCGDSLCRIHEFVCEEPVLIAVCVCVRVIHVYAGISGVCAVEDIWQVRAPADASGLPLPPDLPLEICLR